MPLVWIPAIWPTMGRTAMRILLRGRPSVAAVSQYTQKPGDREAVGLFSQAGLYGSPNTRPFFNMTEHRGTEAKLE